MSRPERVAQALRREISNIIHDEIKDPRIGFVTIVRIEMSDDLRYAKVFYSILGPVEQEKKTQEALESAKGFIRKLIGDRVKMRYTPEISFIIDKSGEYSVRIEEELNKIKELENEPRPSYPEEAGQGKEGRGESKKSRRSNKSK